MWLNRLGGHFIRSGRNVPAFVGVIYASGLHDGDDVG